MQELTREVQRQLETMEEYRDVERANWDGGRAKRAVNDLLHVNLRDATITVEEMDCLSLAVFDLLYNPRKYLMPDSLAAGEEE
jgi:hypothetical protein